MQGGAWGATSFAERPRHPHVTYGGNNFNSAPKVYNYSNPWDNPRPYGNNGSWERPKPPLAYAGAPGATHWDTQKSVLYPPPKWAVAEAEEMSPGLRAEMGQLFNQSWFLELVGDAQRPGSL